MPEQKKDQQEKPLADITGVNELLRSLGQIVNGVKLYGPQHKVVMQQMDSTHKLLAMLLAECEDLNLSIADEELLADGRGVDTTNPLIAAFEKQLIDLDAAGFSLTSGMTKEEFDKLIEVLTTHPDQIKAAGGFAELMAGSGMEHVKARVATYQLVTEEEEVVSRDDGEGGQATTEEMLAQMIALLKGEQVEDQEGVAHQVAAMATDVNALADVIIEAAKIQQQQEGLEGEESLVAKVIDTVRRYYDAAMQDPAAGTQAGKKQLTKTLNELEGRIEERLQELEAEAHREEATEPLVEAVEEMTTELAIDSLASEYARKYKGIAKAQKKILKFIKSTLENRPDAGIDLKSRLIESGLSEEDWDDLVLRSKGRAPTELSEGPVISAVLAQMLEELEVLDQAEAELTTDQLERVIGGISQELSAVSSRAEHQIEELGSRLRESVEKPEEAERILSRTDLMAMLAEIGQEICQPLSVINASIDMIGAGRLGPITDPQTEMLTLAQEGSDRLQKLADKLIEIAGVPEGTTPDSEILGDIYGGEQPQNG